MNGKELLSEERLDFVREMMSIGAGNAATALRQLLQCEVNLSIPKLTISPAPQLPALLGDASLAVSCVKMDMVGDVRGEILFLVPDVQKENLIHLVERAMPGPKKSKLETDVSVLVEIGNILAGVYLTAIHDFCKLNIYHTVPTLAIDMLQSLMDEPLAALSRESQVVLLVETDFMLKEAPIKIFFLLLASESDFKKLGDSIERARMAYGSERD
ncbi:chemotaxis protein CheC [Acidobacteriia bacterium AH_259_A11_L15]|nr:chemotaxis protein CheC [Acidobacteriia bacterium AH_259_A11_L15]